MKNKLPVLLAIVALLGFTATAAEAHTGSPSPHYYNYHHHHYHFYNGCWYDEAGVCVGGPGFVINIGF